MGSIKNIKWLAAGVFYLFLICLAHTLAGCSSGGGDNVSAPDTTAPDAPTGLSATAASQAQINLAWNVATDNVGVTGYRIYRDGAATPVKDTGDASTSDTGLASARLYCYQVSAYDAAGNESGKSSSVCASTMPNLPDTGQTASYTTTFGEDHDYTLNPPSYTINGNGTVSDNVTGLMWQQQDDGVTRIWDDAITYCNNSGLAGYSDWRLPSKKELMGIVDYGRYNPAIDTTAFPNTTTSGYWSSTTSANNPVNAWDVGFTFGHVLTNDKVDNLYARCVRGGQ